jgi:ribosomal protein S18 acetylase RimI-like enzyme
MNCIVEKIDVKGLETFKELLKVFEDVFEMSNFKIPGDDHLMSLLSRDNFFSFAAMVDKAVVGGLTGYILHPYYSEKKLAYIFDLAVKRELQRKGIGSLLLQNTRQFCKELGCEEVFVQADQQDDHAVKFYLENGGVQENVYHFTYAL